MNEKCLVCGCNVFGWCTSLEIMISDDTESCEYFYNESEAKKKEMNDEEND